MIFFFFRVFLVAGSLTRGSESGSDASLFPAVPSVVNQSGSTPEELNSSVAAATAADPITGSIQSDQVSRGHFDRDEDEISRLTVCCSLSGS